jgi:hypothetical protein
MRSFQAGQLVSISASQLFVSSIEVAKDYSPSLRLSIASVRRVSRFFSLADKPPKAAG